MKKINDYKLLILDMDGTLYFQKPLRLHMAIKMFLYYICHFYRIKDIRIIKKYRQIRETEEAYLDNNFIEKQFAIVGKKYNVSEEYVKQTINNWMFDKPLKYIKKYADNWLINILNILKKEGTKIIIYSDYPAKKKLDVLNLEYDLVFSSEDKNIMCLKPNTKGLNYILETTKINHEDVLLIGDRFEKDGECAKGCNIDFLILDSNPNKRKKQLEERYK